jgi:hypothetical protein
VVDIIIFNYLNQFEHTLLPYMEFSFLFYLCSIRFSKYAVVRFIGIRIMCSSLGPHFFFSEPVYLQIGSLISVVALNS